jgi:serine/threonine protein kinase/tetratricopeptide (TPR) repeat protein
MTHESFQRVAELFQQASSLQGHARKAFLDEVTAGNEALRADLERLLAADADVPSYFEEQALASGAFRRAADALENDEAMHPEFIGDYRILGVLGRGGMGIVYRAQHPNRPVVALKVIRAGLITAVMLRRFEHETQVLSRLRHPGIARIVDLGTFDGENGPCPYFALEFVDGPPLLEFAESRQLSITDRLRLICEICQAVQYAHTKGVIHRDLKPANILVIDHDGVMQPKVLDFGVARATDSERVATTLRTSTGQLVGTLRYMSPEQVGGDPGDIDTRSDVYALGVMAYELLTERMPYEIDELALPDAARVIREQSPRSVDRALRGDIETVLRRAMEKERDRRYQSPAALGADLSRLIDGAPIEARRDSPWYVARKLASRHRGPVAAALGFLVLVAVLLGVMVYDSLERSRRAAEAVKLAAIFLDEEAATDPFRQGVRSTPEKLEDFALWVEASLEDLPEVESNSRNTIGLGYHELGLYEEAELHFQRALARRRSVLDPPHEDLASDLELLARAQYHLSRYEDAMHSYEQAVAMRRALYEGPHVDLASSIDGIAACLKRQGRFNDAEALYQEALEMRRAVLPLDDPWIAASMNNLAACRHMQGRIDEAEAMFREALELAQRAGVKSLFIARGQRNVARCRLQRGDIDDAERIILATLDTLQNSGDASHPDVHASETLLGRCALARGDLAQAAHLGQAALQGQLNKLKAPHDAIAVTRTLLVEVKLEQGYTDEAAVLAEQVSTDRKYLYSSAHPEVLAAERMLAEVMFERGAYEQVNQVCAQLMMQQRNVLDEDDPEFWATMALRGRALLKLGRVAEAEPILRQTVRLSSERLPTANWTVVRGQVALAQCLAEQDRFDESIALLRRAEESLKVTNGVPHRQAVVRDVLRGVLVAVHEGGNES